MSEKITKSWIEKAIHEKAVKKFEGEVYKTCASLGQGAFANAYLSLYKEHMDIQYRGAELTREYNDSARERFMKLIFANYDKLKSQMISNYEKQITNRLLNDMSGLRDFLED